MAEIEKTETKPQSLAVKILLRHAKENIPEMRLLFGGGKLKGDWGNVTNHQLVQAAAGLIVSEALALPTDQTEVLFRAILVHDWNKRLDIRPGDFGTDDLAKAESLLQTVNPDVSLIESTSPGFHDKIINGEATLLQKLQYYLDDITRGEEIAPLEDRLAEVAVRRSDLDADFWARELQAGEIVEQELFQVLKEKGIEIDKTADITSWINSKLNG